MERLKQLHQTQRKASRAAELLEQVGQVINSVHPTTIGDVYAIANAAYKMKNAELTRIVADAAVDPVRLLNVLQDVKHMI